MARDRLTNSKVIEPRQPKIKRRQSQKEKGKEKGNDSKTR